MPYPTRRARRALRHESHVQTPKALFERWYRHGYVRANVRKELNQRTGLPANIASLNRKAILFSSRGLK